MRRGLLLSILATCFAPGGAEAQSVICTFAGCRAVTSGCQVVHGLHGYERESCPSSSSKRNSGEGRLTCKKQKGNCFTAMPNCLGF